MNFKIKPDEIDLSRGLKGTMSGYGTDLVAFGLMDFFQHKGGWVPFSEQEVISFLNYRRANWAMFEKLCRPQFLPIEVFRQDGSRKYFFKMSVPALIRFVGGKYRVTDEFVELCYKKYPRKEA